MSHSSARSPESTMTFSSSLPLNPIWFQDWKPQTVGATLAVCLGLSCLTILYKFTASFKPLPHQTTSTSSAPTRLLQDGSRDRLILCQSENLDDAQKLVTPHNYALPRTSETHDYPDYPAAIDVSERPRKPRRPLSVWYDRLSLAFTTINLLRCLLVTFQAGLGYMLMLAVMSYNVYYFFAILLGTFIGEAIFGQSDSTHDHN